MDMVCSAPRLCSHHLTHHSMIMAQLVPNSWTIIGESGFVIWLRGAGNCGLWGLGGVGAISLLPKALPNMHRRGGEKKKREDCFKVNGSRL